MHGPCVAGPLQAGRRAHLELFAERRVVVVPAHIGVRGARCRARVWTRDPTGVAYFESSATLGDLFSVWGAPLGRARLLAFPGRVRVFRNGAEWSGDPRRLVLREGDEIVLEVGGYVPPHRSYRSPPH